MTNSDQGLGIDGIDLRVLTPRDLAFADLMRALAGWNQTCTDWRRLLTCEPDGCFVAEWCGAPAGTATTTCYGPELGWIGMLLVRPDCRGRGIGSALLRHCLHHLEGRGVRCAKLDATPLGKPLYERFGFKAEWSVTRWETQCFQPDSPDSPGPVAPWTQTDLAQAVALDQEVFGWSRPLLLEQLAEHSLALALSRSSDQQLNGYGMLREGARACYLGPVTARSPEVGAEIVRRLLARASGQPVFWDVPDLNTAATSLAKTMGFNPQRQLLRMFRGDNPNRGDPQFQFGIVDPAVG